MLTVEWGAARTNQAVIAIVEIPSRLFIILLILRCCRIDGMQKVDGTVLVEADFEVIRLNLRCSKFKFNSRTSRCPKKGGLAYSKLDSHSLQAAVEALHLDGLEILENTVDVAHMDKLDERLVLEAKVLYEQSATVRVLVRLRLTSSSKCRSMKTAV